MKTPYIWQVLIPFNIYTNTKHKNTETERGLGPIWRFSTPTISPLTGEKDEGKKIAYVG